MAKLTSQRVNGIRSGYWSPAKKEELVQRLGSLEHLGPDMLGDICDHCCKYPEQYGLEDERRLEICDKCPMNHLMRMMGME